MLNHPILPAGFNADDNNGDEIDGAGTNWAIWPYLFDSFIPLEVLIITPEMMEIFDGCADYVVPFMTRNIPVDPVSNLYVLPAVNAGLDIPIVEAEIVINATDNVIAFPAQQSTLVIPGESLKRSA